MTKHLHIEENTYREMAEALFPGNGHSKLARSGIEYLIREAQSQYPTVDIATLRDFVSFLIKDKGYN